MDTLTEQTPIEALNKLVEEAKTQRLSPADEERASSLLREMLKGGRAGIVAALEPMMALPWIVGVNAIVPLWTELTAPKRRYVLTGLSKNPAEQARRLHLSLARAIYRIDPAAGAKIAASAAADLGDAETGILSQRNRQVFFHVFVGKGKPWILQLPLADLKPAEADALLHAAIESLPLCPPLSQFTILRWAHTSGRFKKIQARDFPTLAKCVGRWNVRLQRQLKDLVGELPEALAAVFKPEALKPRPAQNGSAKETSQENGSELDDNADAPSARQETSQHEGSASEVDEQEAEASPNGEGESDTPEASTAPQPDTDEDDEVDQEEDEAPEATTDDAATTAALPEAPEELVIPNRDRNRANRNRANRERTENERRPKERQSQGRTDREGDRRDAREPREARDVRARAFDLKETLRGLETYVTSIKSELEQTKTQLRRREDESRRAPKTISIRSGEDHSTADVEALKRHNVQLENTVQELRHQLEELANHHESVAESRLLHTDAPLPEGSAEQLKALLEIKLNESFATYKAMRMEPLDKVFRLDYRDLLGSVFDVLLQEGVKLKP